jgi:inner membrane transporter RhtA
LVLAEHLTLAQGVAIALVMTASMGTAWSAGQDKRVTPGSGQA